MSSKPFAAVYDRVTRGPECEVLAPPLWSRVAGGRHPNRDLAAAARAGFALQRHESFDPFPRLASTRPMPAAVAVGAATGEG